MKSKWIEYSLGDIVSLTIDHRGLTPKKLKGDWAESGYRALSAKNVKTGKIVCPDAIRYVDKEMYKRWMPVEIEYGDIIVTSEAPFGEIYQWNRDEKIVLSQRLFAVRIKEGFDPRFVYYYMLTNEFQGDMRSRATGTTVIGLRQPELMKCKVKCPDYETQKKIAAVLKVIDDKIEVNEEISKNLDDQAKAIFKEWFIDNKDITKWKYGCFSDVIESTLGGDWGKEEETGNYTKQVYCVRGADIPDVKAGNKGKMPTRFILPKNFKAKRLVTGDIVVEISGGSPTQSTGRVAAVSQSLLDRYDKEMVCTNFCRALKPLAGYSMFVYYYWQYLYDHNIFFSYENGTTGIKNLDISGFLQMKEINIPPKELAEKFNHIGESVFNEIFANGFQNEQLLAMRDSLVVSLMSGNIDVSQVKV